MPTSKIRDINSRVNSFITPQQVAHLIHLLLALSMYLFDTPTQKKNNFSIPTYVCF